VYSVLVVSGGALVPIVVSGGRSVLVLACMLVMLVVVMLLSPEFPLGLGALLWGEDWLFPIEPQKILCLPKMPLVVLLQNIPSDAYYLSTMAFSSIHLYNQYCSQILKICTFKCRL
jgi:hypothetical protein